MRILIIILVLTISIFTFIDSPMVADFIDNYDIDGWVEVEIPTDTVLKANVKLPENWSFIDKNGKIYIKDSNDDIIATELYCEWYQDGYIGSKHYSNVDNLQFNDALPEELQDLDAYDVCVGGSTGANAYRIELGDTERYAISFRIMSSLQIDGDYVLMMVFEDGFNDEKILSKMVHSFEYGGHYDY